MTLSLTACASSTRPQLERAHLPAAPANFGKPIPPPPIRKGASVRTTAMENRAALHQANKRLENDGAFWRDVEKNYGREPEPESWWPFKLGDDGQ
jgi:hypothetical protein